MRLRTVLIVFVALAGVSLAAMPVEAARRDALHESELIRDKDDVFLYPQLAVDYANLLSFEFGSDATTGNATMLIGGEGLAGGVAIHRGNLFEMSGFRNGPVPPGAALDPNDSSASLSLTDFHLAPTNAFPYLASDDLEVQDPDSPLPNPGSSDGMHTMFDLLIGASLGAGKLGARLSIGVGGQSNNPSDDDASSEGELSLLARSGYTYEAGGLKIDSALSLVFNTGDNNDLASGTDSTGNVFGFGLEGRLYNELTDRASLGALLDAGVSSMSIDDQSSDDAPTAKLSTFMIQTGAGPVFTIGGENPPAGRTRRAQNDESPPGFEEDDRETSSETARNTTPRSTTEAEDQQEESFSQSAEIAGYGVFGYSSLTRDPDDNSQNDEVSATSTIVPGFHLAGEYHVLQWLYLRTGAQYWFAHFSTRRESDQGPEDWGFDNHQFGWSAGLGIEVGQFRFDGSFNKGFLRAGPEFLGGDADGLFGSVAAQYTW